MPYFKDAEELYRAIGGLFKKLAKDPQIGKKVADAKLIIRFIYKNPDATITIDATKPSEDGYATIHFGECDVKPEIEMSMAADIAHEFWHGKVNLLAALTTGKMKAKGPINKIMKILPILKPAYKLYPEHLKEIGMEDRVIK